MAPRFLSRHWAGGRATYNIQGGGCRGSGRKGMREVLSMWRVRSLGESRWRGLASSNLWGWARGDISHSGTVRGKREEGPE